MKATKDGLTSTSIVRHETGIRAVMNCSSYYDGRNHHLATGEDELCRTYSVKYKVVTPSKADTGESDFHFPCGLSQVDTLVSYIRSSLALSNAPSDHD